MTNENSNIVSTPIWSYYNQRMIEAGLTSPALIDLCGIRPMPPGQLSKIGVTTSKVRDRWAIAMPIYDENRVQQEGWSCRMIGDAPPDYGMGPGITEETVAKTRKRDYPKYISAGPVDLHFPPVIDWSRPYPTIFVTEGMLKATALATKGIPCASIQGKDMFAVKGSNLLVPGLERLIKRESLNQIIYLADSDANTNKDIYASAVRLTGILIGRRRDRNFATFGIVPSLPNFEKTGIDDWINAKSPKEFFDSIKGWLKEWEGGKWVELMDKLNERICWVESTTNYVDIRNRVLMNSSSAEKTVAEFCKNIGVLTNPYSGQTIKLGQAYIANSFDVDPFRNKVSGVDFYPGMPNMLPNGKFNLWEDKSPAEQEGDITPFLESAKFAYPNKVERDLVFRLVLHRILYPYLPAPLMMFVFGSEGTGKSACITALFESITAPEYYHVGELHLGYAHETTHANKQALCMEEPTKSGMTSKDMESKLKLMSGPFFSVNPKGLSVYSQTNRLLVCINSNEIWLPASGEARRWLMVKSSGEGHEPEAAALYRWMERTYNFGGMIRHWLKSNYTAESLSTLSIEASELSSKKEVLRSNQHPAITEFEEFLSELPDALIEAGAVPVRLMSMMPPYAGKDSNRYNSDTQNISKKYPIIDVGNTQNNVKISDGIVTNFRVTSKDSPFAKGVASTAALKEVYQAWINHINTRK